jgi:hypothetical protein
MPSLIHPYRNLTGGAWLRGNLHTHSTRSDGERSPQAVVDDYARRGYGFLMFSDHSVLATEADLAALDSRGLVLMPGVELAGGPHILHVDAVRPLTPGVGRQQALNEIMAQERETGRGFAIVNHPNWEKEFDHCTMAQLREWTGYLGLEIYNGVINRLDGSPYATDKWDRLLAEGRQVWGFANDDSHRAMGDTALGWNVAYVKERTCAGVVEALRQGRFYASTGVVIRSIQVEGARIRIETENAHRLAAVRDTGARLAVRDDSLLEIEVPERARYVRVECWGQGEQMAWTQPFVVRQTGEGEDETGTAFIPEWRVSHLAEGEGLAAASLEKAIRLGHVVVPSIRDRVKGLYGFVDARPQIGGQPGVVYFMADVHAPAPGRGTIFLGYDGPIRVWLNDREIFDGPGENPAVVDHLAMHAPFRAGINRLVVALDTNRGKAWGIFGRVQLGV